jgi:surface antigen
VSLVLLGGHFTSATARSDVLSKLDQSAGYGSVLDAQASAQVAANVASQTNMLISADATQTASKLSSQVALAGTDETLDKRQVVSTAQSVRHDVISYTVLSGDTLSGIASKFNITSDTVRWANGIEDADSLKPGQALKILPVTGLSYTVAAGDTAASLASRFQANEAQIAEYNDADVKGLAAGQQIIIPEGVIQEAAKPKPVAAVASASAAVTPSYHYVASYGNGYAFGYCTWYVAGRRSIPGNWGDARSWYYNAQFSGYDVGSAPAVGAIAWTSAGWYGHVAYVESVSGGMVTVSEMNYNGNWDRVTSRTVPASSFKYIY